MKKGKAWVAQQRHPSGIIPHSQKHVLLVLLEDGSDVLEYVWREQVYSTVYDVTDKGAGLLHIVQNLIKKRVCHNYTCPSWSQMISMQSSPDTGALPHTLCKFTTT